MKLSAKQEAFCQAIAEGSTQADAYRLVYSDKGTDAVTHSNASRLMKNGKIIARLSELKERAMKRHDVTIDTIMAELEEARGVAKDISQPSAMVSASMGKAKVAGLIVEKQETKHDGEVKIFSKIEIVHVSPPAENSA